ncbi:MAG: Crp/Fnr family transcriptional regulator [Bacillota bacterium]|nr:Crp/Fnr family transcriptional regulator [Bacillota bacterium]
MEISDIYPVWDELPASLRNKITESALEWNIPAGTVIHNGSSDCTGLILVQSGRLRAFILSEDGKEITLYRLIDRDICLFTASCAFHSMNLNIVIEAEKDTRLWVIPTDVYKNITDMNLATASFTNELMADRLSQVMWLVEQIMWQSFDKRLASFLLEESALEGTTHLSITHETIANHLGSAREVVTRMLKYFQNEGILMLSRKSIEIKSPDKLKALITA